jgi:hypothetical protein
VAGQERRWIVLFALMTIVVLAFQLEGRRRTLARVAERELSSADPTTERGS